jgi:excinuclease UvrABC ATPase subunit
MVMDKENIEEYIHVIGAREKNLKNIDVKIHKTLYVFCLKKR